MLVTDILSFDDPDESYPRKIVTFVYQVSRSDTDLNWGLRLNGLDAY